MNVRHAACDPCRDSKVACDHERPVCARCRARGRNDECIYRTTPFKRKRKRQGNGLQNRETRALVPQNVTPDPPTSVPSRERHHYPNPGFLGPSSHSTIFDQVNSTTSPIPLTNSQHESAPTTAVRTETAISENSSDRDSLSMIGNLTVLKLKSLLDLWIGSGVCLPLAGPLVLPCAQAVYAIADGSTPLPSVTTDNDTWFSAYSRALSESTAKPLRIHKDTTSLDFLAQLGKENTRWESLGIFFTAAARAALDIALCPSLFTSEKSRRHLVKLLTHAGNYCLEMCLSIDCMNDLQLILQYENFILYSQVHGDQSYQTSRKMGDLATSVFALGYHEPIHDAASKVPQFLLELRKSAFCRIHAADKNLALFLGRPPRIPRPYYCLQLPVHIPGVWKGKEQRGPSSRNSYDRGTGLEEEPESDQSRFQDIINYTAHTRCAAVFASIKEGALPLFRSPSSPHRIESARILIDEVDQEWDALPSNFKLNGSLAECHAQSPFERDFLGGVRLDYLHTRFVLQLTSQTQISEPSHSILDISREMLSYVVELIVLREQLVNSGTSLIWKVAHFGLPPAGVVSLALLKSNSIDAHSRSKMLQNLSVLATVIRLGAVISAADPDYALFSKATSSIQSLLDKSVIWDATSLASIANPEASAQPGNAEAIDQWDSWINSDHWDFEIDFWENLAEHPVLQGASNVESP